MSIKIKSVFPCPPPPNPGFASEICRHYDAGEFLGSAPCCKKGVLIENGNIVLAKTCLSDPANPCALREEFTAAERDAYEAWSRHGMERDIVCMGAIPNSGRGEGGSVDCPACGTGKINWVRASCNGHLHAHCTTPDCFWTQQ